MSVGNSIKVGPLTPLKKKVQPKSSSKRKCNQAGHEYLSNFIIFSLIKIPLPELLKIQFEICPSIRTPLYGGEVSVRVRLVLVHQFHPPPSPLRREKGRPPYKSRAQAHRTASHRPASDPAPSSSPAPPKSDDASHGRHVRSRRVPPRAAGVGAGAGGRGLPRGAPRRRPLRALGLRRVPPPGEAPAPPLRRLGRRDGRHRRHRPRHRLPPRRRGARARPRRPQPGEAGRRRRRDQGQAPQGPRGADLRARLRQRGAGGRSRGAQGLHPGPRRGRARQQRRAVLPVRALLPRGGRGADAQPDPDQRRGRHAGHARRAARHGREEARRHCQHRLRRRLRRAFRSALLRLRRHQSVSSPVSCSRITASFVSFAIINSRSCT